MAMIADVVIIGGGIVGVSIAYCLGLKKPRKFRVVLLEKEALCSGSTSKSVGVIYLQHFTRVEIELIQWSLETIRHLDERSQMRLDFNKIGFIHLCHGNEEADRLRQNLSLQKGAGVQVHWLECQDLLKIIPQLTVSDVSGAAFTPDDGYLDPYLLTTAMAKQARDAGIEVEVGTEVEAVIVERERVRGVMTNKGKIEAPTVINAAGPWAGIIAKMVGSTMPIKLIRGQILAVRPKTRLTRVVPMTLDMSTGFYFREETGGLILLGKLDKAFDADSGPIDPDDYYEYKEKPDDAFKDFIIKRVNEKLPSFNDSQLVQGWVGLRTVTPDCLPILGETEVKGFLCATGFSGAGIQMGPATGQIISDFILDGTPSPYLEILSRRRFLGTNHGLLPFTEKSL
ncbi:MAG: FAD-binding oxidoreductase [Syntrophobacterales bacterium]|nr:MAG: FAD-binding oxidoreductase [Syntrophobacterales bacterium]